MELLWLNIAVVIASAFAGPCQPGQERFCHSCYWLLNEGAMQWETASGACSDMGGAVAVPDSPAEHRFLWEMFTGSIKKGNLWIGCTNKVHSNGICGNKCNYLKWAPDEPNQSTTSGCVHMWRDHDGLFDDAACYTNNYAICENPATTPLTLCLGSDADGRFGSPCLTGYVIHQFPTQGAMACGSACCEHPDCRSFNLQQSGRRDQMICQLNNVTRGEATALNTIADNNCTYFNV